MEKGRGRIRMAFRQLLLLFIGLSAGGVIAAGIFAFLAMIGVLPRLVGVTGTKKQIRLYETMMILGGVGGVTADRYQNGLTEAFRCAASRLLLFAGAAGWGDGGAAVLRCLGQIFLGIFGLAAGIFLFRTADTASRAAFSYMPSSTASGRRFVRHTSCAVASLSTSQPRWLAVRIMTALPMKFGTRSSCCSPFIVPCL